MANLKILFESFSILNFQVSDFIELAFSFCDLCSIIEGMGLEMYQTL